MQVIQTKKAISFIRTIAMVLAISIAMCMSLLKTHLCFAGDNPANIILEHYNNEKNIYSKLDDYLQTSEIDESKMYFSDNHVVAKGLKHTMDQTGYFTSECADILPKPPKCSSLSEDEILESLSQKDTNSNGDTILESLQKVRNSLDSDDDCDEDSILKYDKMISIFERIYSRDVGQIRSITTDEIEIVRTTLGSEIADNIKTTVNISKIDATVSKNIDLSTLPYSEETGELQFSSISWANLGPVVGRIHINFENPDDSGETDIIVSDWTTLGQIQNVSLIGKGLKNGVRFRFYTEVLLGFDSYWSNWYTYNDKSDFEIGYYTDSISLNPHSKPIPTVYGNADYVSHIIKNMRSKTIENFLKMLIPGTLSLAFGVIISVTTFGTMDPIIALAGTGLGFVNGIAFIATNVILTVNTSEVTVEDIDLEKQGKDKNWYFAGPSASQTENSEKNNGLFAISGFHYVSAGFFWSKPVVHWRSPSEPNDADHTAYVNDHIAKRDEIECSYEVDAGLRLGKASGEDLADLSRMVIVDMKNPNNKLKDGDIIWFSAKVTLGKDRIANERFIYSRTSDYKAGYFAQGTLLKERGFEENPSAHLVAFGEINNVSYEMSKYVTTANALFWGMIISVSIGIILVEISTALDFILKARSFGGVDKMMKLIEDKRYHQDAIRSTIDGLVGELKKTTNFDVLSYEEKRNIHEDMFKAGVSYGEKTISGRHVSQRFLDGVDELIGTYQDVFESNHGGTQKQAEFLLRYQFLLGIQNVIKHPKLFPFIPPTLFLYAKIISLIGNSKIIPILTPATYWVSSSALNYVNTLIQNEQYYKRDIKELEVKASEDETSAMMLALIGPVSDCKGALYQLFYDIETYIDREDDFEKTDQLSALSNIILYTLFKESNSNSP